MARRRRPPAAFLVAVVTLTFAVASGAMGQRELSLSFTSEAQAGSALPVNDSFVFDGSTSDIARQLYLRHAAGETIDQVIPDTIPVAVTTRLTALNVSYYDLPGLLQRALLWDCGFVISPENDAVQVWTLGGRSMANLAVSKVEFDTTGCTALNCSQPDDSTYNANKLCTGTQMLTAAKCLIDDFDPDTSTHLAMWSDGGDLDVVPEIRAVMHGWVDSSTNDSYLLYAVHTMSADAEPAYSTCNKGGYGSLVVPCYPMSNTSADVVAVMAEPVVTPWVTTWIKQYQPQGETTVNSESDSDGNGFNFWLLIPIILAALLAAMFVIVAVFKKRRQLQAVYWQRDTPADSECGSSRKSKPSGPLTAPRQRDNRTSLRRTEQETIGEFNRTLRLPGEDDSPVEEPSPVIEEILPRPRRNTAPVSRTTTTPIRNVQAAARGSLPAVQSNVPVVRRGTMPAAHSSTGERAQSTARTATSVRSQSARGAVTPAARQSSSRTSSAEGRQPSARASTPATHPSSGRVRQSSARTSARPSRTSTPEGRSNSEVWSDGQSGRHPAPAARDHLPTLRESVSMPPIRESMPSIRDSIQADRESIPALRETFCRYSAADNVQYTLTTDSNLVGKRIAWERIELGRLLSRGAFGEVWACRYAGKKVAVKRLLQSKKATFHETEKFTNEIQLTASLSHPNIVRFIGVAWSSLESLALVEEYLPRGDLQKYLKRNGDLMSWARDKIFMAIGIAKAIQYLHSREVIHRDIKARNVLLTKRLQPKLVDFGASRIWAPSDMSAGVGTPFWTAPEVLESTEYTEKADIYSFGALLSELDTCEAPYHSTLGPTGEKMKPFHVLKQVVDGSLRPSFTAGCPPRIRRAADACFQRDPKLRPSASELIKLLEG